jgi:hypothetical protein
LASALYRNFQNDPYILKICDGIIRNIAQGTYNGDDGGELQALMLAVLPHWNDLINK